MWRFGRAAKHVSVTLNRNSGDRSITTMDFSGRRHLLREPLALPRGMGIAKEPKGQEEVRCRATRGSGLRGLLPCAIFIPDPVCHHLWRGGRLSPDTGRCEKVKTCRESEMRNLAIIALSLSLALVVATACGGLSEAEKQYNEGVDAANARQFEESVALFTKAIELDRDYAQAYMSQRPPWVASVGSARRSMTPPGPSSSSLTT